MNHNFSINETLNRAPFYLDNSLRTALQLAWLSILIDSKNFDLFEKNMIKIFLKIVECCKANMFKKTWEGSLLESDDVENLIFCAIEFEWIHLPPTNKNWSYYEPVLMEIFHRILDNFRRDLELFEL